MNIGVNISDGTVAFFDADTYHFKDIASGHTHRCRACCPGYVAPELIANCKRFSATHPEIKDVYANAPLPTFSLETDNFALSIHIFKLIMNGYTPYKTVSQRIHPFLRRLLVLATELSNETIIVFLPAISRWQPRCQSIPLYPNTFKHCFLVRLLMGMLCPLHVPLLMNG